jgi:hypothetical protein
LPIAYEGVEDSQRADLDAAFAERIDGEGFSLERAESDLGCGDTACLQRAGAERGATHIVRAKLTGTDRDYEMTVEVIDVGAGTVAALDGFCDTCGASELREFVVDKAVRLHATLRSQRLRPALLVIATQPAGALVYLDDEPIGRTPLEHQTIAGERRVKVVLDGHVTAQRAVSLVGGVEKRVELTLDRRPDVDTESNVTAGKKARIGKIVGGTSLGVGVGLLGAGIALLVLDGNPIERKCNGENVDADNDCKFLHDTLAGGIGLTVGGAALAGAGVGLLVWGLRQPKTPKASARLGITPRGVVLHGRF